MLCLYLFYPSIYLTIGLFTYLSICTCMYSIYLSFHHMQAGRRTDRQAGQTDIQTYSCTYAMCVCVCVYIYIYVRMYDMRSSYHTISGQIRSDQIYLYIYIHIMLGQTPSLVLVRCTRCEALLRESLLLNEADFFVSGLLTSHVRTNVEESSFKLL